MTTASQEYLIVSQRDQPTELHLSDGTVALLEPHGTLTIAGAVRASPQLLALERQRAVRVRPSAAAPEPPPEELEAPDAGVDESPRPVSRSKRTRTK